MNRARLSAARMHNAVAARLGVQFTHDEDVEVVVVSRPLDIEELEEEDKLDDKEDNIEEEE